MASPPAPRPLQSFCWLPMIHTTSWFDGYSMTEWFYISSIFVKRFSGLGEISFIALSQWYLPGCVPHASTLWLQFLPQAFPLILHCIKQWVFHFLFLLGKDFPILYFSPHNTDLHGPGLMEETPSSESTRHVFGYGNSCIWIPPEVFRQRLEGK